MSFDLMIMLNSTNDGNHDLIWIDGNMLTFGEYDWKMVTMYVY